MPEFPNQDLLQQRQQLRDMAQSYRQAQILLTCVELGVFETLAGRTATAAEVAVAVEADPHGVELLLNTAAALGLLDKRNSCFANAALTETWLAPAGWLLILHDLSREQVNAIHGGAGPPIHRDLLPPGEETRQMLLTAGFDDVQVQDAEACYVALGRRVHASS